MIIAGMLFLGLLLPSLSYHDEAEMAAFQKKHPILFEIGATFDPPALTSSKTFVVLNILLFTSTVLCSIQRVRDRNFRGPQAEKEYFRHNAVVPATLTREQAAKRAHVLLARKRWRPTKSETRGEVVFRGEKGAYGFWGSIVFHLGFLVLLLGVLISARTRFSGAILLTEGQALPVARESFTQIDRSPVNTSFPPGSVGLDRVVTDYGNSKQVTEYTNYLTFTALDGKQEARVIRVNEAIRHAGLIYAMENYGYAPKFIIADNKNNILLDAFINLKGRTPGSKDEFAAPGTDIAVKTSFLPDIKNRQSLIPREPAIHVTVTQNGKTLGDGVLTREKRLRLKNLTVEFKDMRHWSYFRVSRDKGAGILFWGLVLSTAGLIVRFVLHDRTVKIAIEAAVEGSTITVSGKSKYFPALFEQEIHNLAERMGELT